MIRQLQKERIETHLLDGIILEARSGSLPRLVVNDAQGTAAGRTIHAVNEPAQTNTVTRGGLHQLLATCGLEELGAFHCEIAAENLAHALMPRAKLALIGKKIENIGGGMLSLFPCGVQKDTPALCRALRRGEIEEAIQRLVNDGSHRGGLSRWLFDAIHDVQTELQGASTIFLGATDRQSRIPGA